MNIYSYRTGLALSEYNLTFNFCRGVFEKSVFKVRIQFRRNSSICGSKKQNSAIKPNTGHTEPLYFSGLDSNLAAYMHIHSKEKIKLIQPQFEAMRGAHLLFYSHEQAYKMTYDCWLDIR